MDRSKGMRAPEIVASQASLDLAHCNMVQTSTALMQLAARQNLQVTNSHIDRSPQVRKSPRSSYSGLLNVCECSRNSASQTGMDLAKSNASRGEESTATLHNQEHACGAQAQRPLTPHAHVFKRGISMASQACARISSQKG